MQLVAGGKAIEKVIVSVTSGIFGLELKLFPIVVQCKSTPSFSSSPFIDTLSGHSVITQT